MKYILTILFVSCLVTTGFAQSNGPTSFFSRVYTLIQEADSLSATDNYTLAAEKYEEAKQGLQQIKSAYPSWHKNVIDYRLDYVTEKLNAIKPNLPQVQQAADEEAAAAAKEQAEADKSTEFHLRMQLRQLKMENENLQSKLREALSAEPATVSTEELAQAESKIQELEEANRKLKSELEKQQATIEKDVDKKELDSLNQQLADAENKISEQTKLIETLKEEKQVLESRVDELAKDDTVEQLRTENKQLQQRVDSLQTKLQALDIQEEAADKIASQAERIEFLQETNKILESRIEALITADRSEELRKENQELCTKISELEAKLESVPSGEVEQIPGQAVSELRERIQQQESTINELKSANQELTNELQTILKTFSIKKPPASTNAAPETPAEETNAPSDTVESKNTIQKLRAHLQAYEENVEPYSKEELGMFNPGGIGINGSTQDVSGASIKRLPAGSDSLAAEARKAFAAGNLDVAEQKYLEILEMDENNVSTLGDLAAIQIEQGNLAAAGKNLTKAINLEPTDAFNLKLMGIVRFRQGNFDKAIDVLYRAAQISPNDPEVYNYLGISLSQKGLRGLAERALWRAVSIRSDYTSAHYNLAVLYATQNPPSNGLFRYHYNKALDLGHSPSPQLEAMLSNQ
ncbi:MAG: tetratricopeptide repeat protein [Verrucomicrobia bacterium]|nr:tetratricopeptide repeat protein [Verrucomicrobiota bacterium]